MTARADAKTPASFQLLCIIVHYAADEVAITGQPLDACNVLDEAKWICAKARLAYQPHQLRAALEAVWMARDKGYPTPRLPSC